MRYRKKILVCEGGEGLDLRKWKRANLTLIRGEKRTSKVLEWKGFSDPLKCRTNG